MKKLFALTALLFIAACAPKPDAGIEVDTFEARDPLRPFNEAMFSFNLGADEYVIRPVAQGYHALPSWFRTGTGNILNNLSEPANGINALLQADLESFGTILFRFILNTTFGLGGIRDFAAENGLPDTDISFDNTLSTYGLGTGPYIVLPIMGPSSLRGTAAFAGDWLTDPFNYLASNGVAIGRAASQAIVTRDQNDEIINHLYYDAIDPYASTRASYLQRVNNPRKPKR